MGRLPVGGGPSAGWVAMSEPRAQATARRRPAAPPPGPQFFTRLAVQLVFLLLVIWIFSYFYGNVIETMNRLGLAFDFRWLKQQAGFGISEGIGFEPSDSYGRAFVVGVVNTLRVVFFGILLATAIGFAAGLARLSSNWLVRAIAAVYVEVFRNTPLLLQLLFWYGAVILKLPPVREAVNLFDRIFLSQRGAYIPRFTLPEERGLWTAYFLFTVVASAAVYWLRRRRLQRLDRPGFPFLWGLGAWAALLAVGWAVLGSPLEMELPVLQRFNFTGGWQLTPEFSAMLLGLSVYTGAFIAEVVRGGIQAVDKGQREAAAALGLRPFHVQYLVVLPQALRTIVPPLTSQYLNLAKNSSLAVAIGYPELFNVGTTTMNQTGQTLPVFLVIVVSYLSLSLLTSLFMNWWNRRLAYMH